MKKFIKHTVIVIVYNHEQFLEVALNSLISQTEAPFEVLIFDDCSADNSWAIIKSYADKYSFIKAKRNNTNLGLHENLSRAQNAASGEVVSCLAGDDYFEIELIERINDEIRKKELLGYSTKFIIIPNAIHLYPNGKKLIWNNFHRRVFSPFKERLRHGLSYRSVGISHSLLATVPRQNQLNEKYPQMGFSVDTIKGLEEVRLCESFHYIDYAGPVYRLGSGITSKTSEYQHSLMHINVMNFIKDSYADFLDDDDVKYIDCQVALAKYQTDKSLNSLFAAAYHWFVNYNNFSTNFPWIRAGKVFLPNSCLVFFKYKIYPFLRK